VAGSSEAMRQRMAAAGGMLLAGGDGCRGLGRGVYVAHCLSWPLLLKLFAHLMGKEEAIRG